MFGTTARNRVVVVAIAAMALAVLYVQPEPCLVWNASASAPIGLYWASDAEPLHKGELVLARPPAWAVRLAAGRGYLPLGVPLIKHVAALPGDVVCARNGSISINGQMVATRLPRDRWNRPLPSWQGCAVVARCQLFLANARVRDSFDGRYFGVSRCRDVLAKLEPLWVP